MNHSCRLSDNTKRYLDRFYCILDEMTVAMTGVEWTESISYDFIIQMIPHHRAAIEMSRNLLQYTTNVSLQNMAENIIEEQMRGIEQMQAAMACCSQLCNSEQEQCLYRRRVDQIMDTMFMEMGRACECNCIDHDFMKEMIPHHEGAVRMAENALKFELCPELVPILERIIRSQRRGIGEMRRMMGCCRG